MRSAGVGNGTFGTHNFAANSHSSRQFFLKGVSVPITIFLDDDTFHRLKHLVPRRSHSRAVLENAEPAGSSNVTITCSETEARNLLLYSDPCPKAVASIQEALRSSGVSRS